MSSRIRRVSRCLVLIALVASGCGRGERRAVRDRAPKATVDALGDTLRLSHIPLRIVSLAPSITELVFDLGAGRRLVGVTDFCDYPPAALKIPHVAGFSTINLEAIVATKPDLVIASRGNLPEDLAAIRRVGIPVFAVEIDSLAELLGTTRALGDVLGVETRADSLVASWTARIDSVKRVAARTPPAERPRVFFGGIAEPIYTVGPGSFVNDLIVTAGGRNIFADATTAWPHVDLETLVERDPDVILIAFHTERDTAATFARLRTAPGWRSLRAVRDGRIALLGDDVMRPGPRLVDALEQISRILYPGAYAAKSKAKARGVDASDGRP